MSRVRKNTNCKKKKDCNENYKKNHKNLKSLNSKWFFLFILAINIALCIQV